MTLTESNIFEFSEPEIYNINLCKTLKILNLTNNRITKVSPRIQKLDNIKEIFLSGNPFDCHCEMTWMITWLNNFSDIVKDYKQIVCGHGRFKGIPIHVLSDIALGCYPSRWTSGQKAGVSVGVVFMTIVFGVLLIVIRKFKEVKFWLFYYIGINTVPKDTKGETTENKKYDAFFCYR